MSALFSASVLAPPHLCLNTFLVISIDNNILVEAVGGGVDVSSMTSEDLAVYLTQDMNFHSMDIQELKSKWTQQMLGII